ncbi:hypothetical protein KY347_01005 [Candidatus Woesearchaeota archaeon]|nr:hypothetical protein [Candidatus Woesearchaeota archaeon]
MILSKDEAVSLVLHFAKNKVINSQTKLNKLLARLNFYMIPIDMDFTLNKYGSFSMDTVGLESNEFYNITHYQFGGGEIPKYIIEEKGEKLALGVIRLKLSKILKPEEIEKLRKEIKYLSDLNADEISSDEHKNLLVDMDEREKLKMRINSVHIDMLDLMGEKKKIAKDSIVNLTLSSLIEYCYYLTQYLMKQRFRNIDEMEYDFDAYMLDYYLLWNLEKQVIPFLKQQTKAKERDEIVLNRYYQYIINFAQSKSYPFSLQNKCLRELVEN